MTSTKHSISAAHRITGKSRTTISSHMKSGKLSYEENQDGEKVIDASELMRVYGEQCNFDQTNTETNKPEKKISTAQSNDQTVQSDLLLAKQKIDSLTEKAESYKEEVEYLRERLDKSDKTVSDIAQLTKLITDQRDKDNSAGDWEKSIKALEDRIANQEKSAIEKAEKEAEEKNEFQKKLEEKEAELKEQKEAFELEQSKSFLHKLFGK